MAFTNSTFALPENPIMRAFEPCGGLGNVGIRPGGGLGAFAVAPWRSIQGLGCSDCGGTCGKCSGLGSLGAIEIDLNEWATKLGKPSLFGMPLWVVLGTAALGILFLTGRGESDLDYRREQRELKRRFPRRGSRYARAASAGWQAGWGTAD